MSFIEKFILALAFWTLLSFLAGRAIGRALRLLDASSETAPHDQAPADLSPPEGPPALIYLDQYRRGGNAA